MKCPACGKDLEVQIIDDITVGVCSGGCGGTWFERAEIQKLNELHESAGETLLDIQTDSQAVVDHNEPNACPKCDNVTMIRHFVSTDKGVNADECSSCAGVWLDYGELRHIRAQFESEEKRSTAVER